MGDGGGGCRAERLEPGRAEPAAPATLLGRGQEGEVMLPALGNSRAQTPLADMRRTAGGKDLREQEADRSAVCRSSLRCP